MTATVTLRKSEAITLEVRHYVQKRDATNLNYKYYSLYSSSSQVVDYYTYVSTSSKSITGYHLKDGYQSSISGKLTYQWVGKYKNTPSSPRTYDYDYVNTPLSKDMDEWSTYHESKQGKMDYCINRVYHIDYYYDLNEYTLSFDANGGSGAPTSITKYYQMDVKLPTTEPTRSGYTFKGWATTSTATTASYQPGANYTSNSGKTFYAVWASNAPTTYTVSYNANGGSGAPASQTKTKDVTLTLSSTKPTRSGYTFKGWSSSSTATTATYSAGGSYTSNAAITLYAVWQKNAVTYTVSYNANGGSGAPASQTKTENVTLTLSSGKPTRSGYTFLGWSTSSTATTASYQPGGKYSGNAALSLYAVWQKNASTYTVSYNANGGSGAPSSQTKTENVTLTLSSTVPTRSGYSFIGWAPNSTATTAMYYPGGSYTINAGATLYAVWSCGHESYSREYVTGCDWNEVCDNCGAVISSGTTHGPYTYGAWTYYSASQHKRTKSCNYGDYSTAEYASHSTSTVYEEYSATQHKVYSYCATCNHSVGSVSYANHSFTTSTSGGVITKTCSVCGYVETSNQTYTVSFNANGGSGAPSSQTKTHGTALTLSSVKPTRSGYSFLGWSTSSTATSATYSAGGSFTTNANTTLYAVWSCNHSSTTKIYTTGCDWKAICDTCGAIINTGTTHGPYSYSEWTYDSTSQHSRVKSCDYGDYATTEYAVHSTLKRYEKYSSLQHKVYNHCSECDSDVGSASYESHNFVATAKTGSTLYTCSLCGYSYETVNTYTVSYHANGGSGAPASQTKTHNVNLTLSSTKPTRKDYIFRGWSTNPNTTTAEYSAGGTYQNNASVTLYAVWEKVNYEFSISELTVSESEIYRYGSATVKVRVDSWDKVNSYANIPVTLLFDGSTVGTQYVNLSAYGVANVTFTLNVGNTLGAHSLEARVNWSDRQNETNPNNNSVTGTVTVKDYDYEVSVNPVALKDNYLAGMTVITSFTVNNDSDYDVLPEGKNTAQFTAYYYSGSSKVVISTQRWEKVVIPAGGTNLIYFKWTVPSGIAGKAVYCECTVNADGALNEQNRSNNTATLQTTVKAAVTSETPDTRYERNAPSGYVAGISAPAEKTGSASWNMWVYENGKLVLKTYGVKVGGSPEATPDASCPTAVKEGGKWKMRSGYGYSLEWSPTISTLSGNLMPESDAYTGVQSVFATLPEYRYLQEAGKYETLLLSGGSYRFRQNEDADGNARIHFIPVYVANGNYTVSVTATQIWTPAGMITATRNANTIVIDGTVYDDWYQG